MGQIQWTILFLFAVVSIVHVMMLLKHADVGLPAEVTRVDGFDEQVHLVVGHVIVVWIASFTAGALVNLHLGAGSGSGAEVGS